jgi:tetratricopeptide (TPR) repeat protein
VKIGKVMTISPSRRLASIVGAWLILAFLIAVLYGRTTTYSFVWDDKELIAQSKVLPRAGVADLLSDFWKNAEHGFESGYFRPLTTLAFFLDFKIHGDNAGGYHLTNVILYWLTCGLVFLFFRRVLDDPSSAMAGALLFALHPAHVEPVAFISSRTDLLAALLVLAAHLVGTGPPLRATGPRCAGAAVLFFLAIMAKESAVPLLLVSPFLAPRESRRALALALLAAAAAAFAVRFAALSSVVPAAIAQKAPLPLRLLTVPAATLYYLRVIFLPVEPSALPALEWVTSPVQARFFLPLLALGGLGWGLRAIRRPLPLVWLGSAWGFVFLLPVVQIVQTTMRAAERFAFLPSVGFALAATAALRGALHSPNGKARIASRALLAVVLASFAVATAARVPVWKDSAALWEATAKAEPGNPTVLNNLANVRFEQGRHGEAEAIYRRAVELAPDNSRALYNLGLSLVRQGRSREALVWLDRALSVDPGFAPARDLLRRATQSLQTSNPPR